MLLSNGGWLIDWLTEAIPVFVEHWLIDWLMEALEIFVFLRLFCRLIDWLIDGDHTDNCRALIDWLIDWPSEWVIEAIQILVDLGLIEPL